MSWAKKCFIFHIVSDSAGAFEIPDTSEILARSNASKIENLNIIFRITILKLSAKIGVITVIRKRQVNRSRNPTPPDLAKTLHKCLLDQNGKFWKFLDP